MASKLARIPTTPRSGGPLLASWLGTLLLTACGGGGSGGGNEAATAAAPLAVAPSPADPMAAAPPGPVAASPAPAVAPIATLPGVSRLVVAGDSLADVGTFGFKFTVQDATRPAGFPIFPELVGAAYGLAPGCSHYMDDGAGGVMPRGNPACTNFAVGGGRILRGDGAQGIPAQLRDAADAVGGRFGAGDLVLVDGGGNDASDLAAAYLAGATSRTGLLAFLAFLAREVDVDDLLATVPGSGSLARSANLYMEKAADALADAIAAHALERGATRVAVLNVPDITLTPRFAAAFERLVQQEGAQEAASIQAAVRQTIGAFNARLRSRFASDPRVVLVDLRAAVDDELARPGTYGLSDAAHAACPVTGTGAAGLPAWTLQTCTSAALDAEPGATPGWWTTWAFSDGFHPTPLGHRLLAATVQQALAAATLP